MQVNNPKKCVGDYFNTQDNETTDNTITFIVSSLWRNIMTTDNIRELILHIPHISTKLPESFHVREGVSLEQELERMTDWFYRGAF